MKKLALSKLVIGFSALLLTACIEKELSPNEVSPSDIMIEYQQMELIGFIHYSPNTYTDKEWGFGDEDPGIFNPDQLDTEQWARTAKEAGLKQLILTAKHHDGFCLWPSKYTEHSVKNSPYKNGDGDIVGEFAAACKKHGLKVGLYLSPWDRNHKDYGSPEYIEYYKNQLNELLTQYGEINEIWFDGANGGDGYYGGANERRKIDSKTYYGWEEIFAMVKKLQPNIKIFSDAGPDVHWIGNEHGFAGETFWSTINTDSLIIGNSDTKYLNSGDPNGKTWIVGQCDVSIRPGWFYHESQDSLVKTPQELVDIYYKSVGRNAILLLNLPPDQRGLIHENDVRALKEFKQIIDETFAHNLAESAKVKSSKSETIVALDKDTTFDRILLQEDISLGQRVCKFSIEILKDAEWQTVFEGTTIGYKRLLRIDPVTTDKLRLKIIESNNTPAISSIEIYSASKNESL